MVAGRLKYIGSGRIRAILPWEDEYTEKTPLSRRHFEKSLKLHVNGVSHNVRHFEPYPFAAVRSSESRIIDADDNQYTDYWMGHWALVLGHGHLAVREALESQIRQGWMFGTFNTKTIDLSEMIAAAVPVAEKMRYTASGTEAVMYAGRLARAHTGRRTIAKMDGGWHGYASDLLKTVNWPFSVPEGAGMTGDADIESLPCNDIEGTLDILRGVDELAGVVIEPVMGGAGGIPIDEEYLRAVQEFVHERGALLILDEIVTGFRLGYGCHYDALGLDPDIVTLGKIVGGGMPLGVLAGKDEIMAKADTGSMSRTRRCYIGGGTFSAHAASMAAGAATLEILKGNSRLYHDINQMGEDARRGISDILGGQACVTGKGSLLAVHFMPEGMDSVRSAADAARCDQDRLLQYHMYMMAKEGIFFLPRKMGAVSSAHTHDDIRDLCEATERFTEI